VHPPEHLSEAMVEVVKACGGTKRIAALLWPAKADQNIEGARRYLANCLNPECNEKLSLDELMLILRTAREAGCHIAMEYLSTALSYAPPQPIEPHDELGDLLRQYLQQRERDKSRGDQIERLIAKHLKSKAVA
jgi:hypothetical protein